MERGQINYTLQISFAFRTVFLQFESNTQEKKYKNIYILNYYILYFEKKKKKYRGL